MGSRFWTQVFISFIIVPTLLQTLNLLSYIVILELSIIFFGCYSSLEVTPRMKRVIMMKRLRMEVSLLTNQLETDISK